MKKLSGVLLILILFSVSCRNKSKKTGQLGAPMKLSYDRVISKEINNAMVFVGETEPYNLYTTQPRINGYLMKKYFVNGEIVKKGELI